MKQYKTIKTILVDDEEPARSRLRRLLSKIDAIDLIKEADNPFSCIDLIDRLRPDLLFLDIQMPGLNGFEMIRQIPPRILPLIIFITAYDQYALKAFNSLSIDYLLKPVRFDDLNNAVNKLDQLKHRFINIKDNGTLAYMPTQIDSEYLKRFVLKYGRKWEVVEEKDVIYFFAEEKYCYLRSNNKNSVINFTLQELETRLDPAIFVRGHRSFILSRSHVKKFKTIGSGRLEIVLSDGTIVKSSRGYLQNLKYRLMQ